MSDGGWKDLLAEGRLARFALICLGVWLNAADALVTATIMPSVAADIGGDAYFGWAIATFLLGAIVAGASGGVVSRRLGLRVALIWGGLVYSAGCALGAGSPEVVSFLVGRLLQGLGAGWVVGLLYVAVGVVFPERHWAKVFAATTSVWGVATLLGPLVGGLFAGAGLWRWAFWLFAVQGLIFCAIAWRLLRNTPRGEAESGLALKQLAILAVAVTVIAAGGLVQGAGLALALVAAGAALLFLMLWVDRRSNPRLLPRDASRWGNAASAGYLMMFALTAAAIGWTVYGAALLQAFYGLSPLEAGYVVAGEALGWTAAALPIAGLADRWHGPFIRLGAALVSVGLLIIAFGLPAGHLWVVVAGSLTLGAGFGCAWAFATRRILGSLPEAERGLGSSAVPATQQIGNAAGAAAVGAVGAVLGLSQGIDAAVAARASPWLFTAFLPLALIGLWAAQRLASHMGGEGAESSAANL